MKPEIPNLLKLMNDKNINYTYILSWVFGKLSETVPSVFGQDQYYSIIPAFIDIINGQFHYNIQINICIVLGNLIKYQMNTNIFNPFYKFIINDFIELSFKENSIKTNLSFYI